MEDSARKKTRGDVSMVVIENVGDYWISSEMLERCLPGWVLNVATFGIAMIAAACVCFSLIGIVPNVGAFGVILLCLAVCILSICIFTPRGCGVQITLEVPNKRTECQEVTRYHFSGDTAIDAAKVEKIINGYRDLANRRMTAKKENIETCRTYREQCCTQYKSVIDQVKRV